MSFEQRFIDEIVILDMMLLNKGFKVTTKSIEDNGIDRGLCQMSCRYSNKKNNLSSPIKRLCGQQVGWSMECIDKAIVVKVEDICMDGSSIVMMIVLNHR